MKEKLGCKRSGFYRSVALHVARPTASKLRGKRDNTNKILYNKLNATADYEQNYRQISTYLWEILGAGHPPADFFPGQFARTDVSPPFSADIIHFPTPAQGLSVTNRPTYSVRKEEKISAQICTNNL